jgi:hypothetical protein
MPDPVEKLQTHRERQVSVAKILDATFGPLAECNTGLWDRRAYLMFVGMVYERLAYGEKEIATDELAALAKILAECRRAAGSREGGERNKDSGEEEAPRSGQLPEQFASAVRQVYGTNFQGLPEGSIDESNQPRDTSKVGA